MVKIKTGKSVSQTEHSEIGAFLDESLLRRLENMTLMARRGVRGSRRGEHISHGGGSSLEFLDYRKYQPGDDIRYVDWNVYGRLDRLFIKVFRAEAELCLHILLDTSRSMAFGDPPKHAAAVAIAAALAYIGLASLDRVGITAFADELKETLPPARGRPVYLSVVNYLLSLAPEGHTSVSECLSNYASTCGQSGVAVVISDLLDPDGVESGLMALKCRGFDIALVHVLDGEELFPALSGHLRVRDMETGVSRTLTLDRKSAKRFRERTRRFVEDTREFCRGRGIDYHLHDTRVSFEDFLLRFLMNGKVFRR